MVVASTSPPDTPSPAGGEPGRERESWRTRLARWDLKGTPYLLILPFFAVFLGFGLFPLLYTGWVSLHDWHVVLGDQGFVGFGNFTRLLADPNFWNALFNTLSIFVISTVPQLLAALGLAALLDRRLRGRTFWRAGVLLPNVVSVVAVALVFAQLFGRDYGVINHVLGWVGIEPINWRSGTWASHLAISVMVMWRWTGYNALIYLAAMQSVPRELYEQAEIDGASRWRTFWAITVPSIRPTIIFTVLVSTIYGLQLFAEPQLFDPKGTAGVGGNSREFQTVTMYLYEEGVRLGDAGYGSTIAWALFLIVLVFAVFNYRLSRRIASKD
ncbi:MULTISPECIES: carbohydrate ABC transporter permease [Actinoalloteichus]|uniref:Cellobiose ABC transporter membrane protein n=1 Tax=Actinoalloteichus fjordicus TaxID=1612552 RepID=A0AAC9LBJ9_9PSEU|nr:MULTISPECIES: sugar ABC transporter permease [Actinoalloteichus]APU13420.1 cellobiose ABC transporter membrane protein [Actinoalloteichus fjordicus]APU19370.1 cellobiose ABC transporter membrane protein [Actinoalloteichus sp. GBA129-24]